MRLLTIHELSDKCVLCLAKISELQEQDEHKKPLPCRIDSLWLFANSHNTCQTPTLRKVLMLLEDAAKLSLILYLEN